MNQPDEISIPSGDTGEKKFNWCSVTPILLLQKPFGHQVEGLFLLKDKTFAVEPPVLTRDFRDSAVHCPISRETIWPVGFENVQTL